MNYVSNRFNNLDGTVERFGEDQQRISWAAHGRDFAFNIAHELERSVFGRDPAQLVAQRPRLLVTWRLAADTNTVDLLDQAEKLLELPLLCLSLLSRRSIRWFELGVTVTLEPECRKHFEARRRVRFWPDDVHDPEEDPVLGEEEAARGEFAAILTALEQSPLASDLGRAIRYHLSSFRANGLESRFILGFAAFETLVNTLDFANPFLAHSAVGMPALEKAIHRIVKCHSTREGLPDLAAQSLRSKVGEFRRPAFVPKALHHLNRLAVDTSHLWIDDATCRNMVDKGLARTSAARNMLVHNTTIGDFTRLRADLARLQCLFERLLFSALGAPRDSASRALEQADWVKEDW
jgi:hypothetical protein